MIDEEERQLLSQLVEAVSEGDKEKISKTKYDNLFYGHNLLSLIPNFIFLIENNIDFDFGYQIIKKGTRLFRVRRYEERVDYSQNKEWSYPPTMPENRANNSGEPALYLGTTELVCVLETHIKRGEKYVLGEYDVIEDIKVGGFLHSENNKSNSKILAGVILNAFFIAPSRSDKNNAIFTFLDNYYNGLNQNDLTMSMAKMIDLPYKFGVLNKKTQLYKSTNRMIKSMKHKYPEGLSFSSCYIPIATIEITCTDSNCVLYEKGMKKIKFVNYKIKTNKNKFTEVDLAKVLTKTTEEQSKIKME